MKGFSGTTVKNTWTKPRGVESGEGLGMAGVGGSGGGQRQTTILEQK